MHADDPFGLGAHKSRVPMTVIFTVLALVAVGASILAIVPPFLATGGDIGAAESSAVAPAAMPRSETGFRMGVIRLDSPQLPPSFPEHAAGRLEPAVEWLEGVSSSDIPSAAPALRVSFKRNTQDRPGKRKSRDRWVSLPRAVWSNPGTELSVEARARFRDAGSRFVDIAPTWAPADPDMVAVAANADNTVSLMVRRAGVTKLRVLWQGVSEEFSIRSQYVGGNIRVVIDQPDVRQRDSSLPEAMHTAALVGRHEQ